MPFRLTPIFVVAALVLMFALGAFDGDGASSAGSLSFDGVITEVDGVLDDALHEDSFDWLSESLNGAVDTVEGGVETVTD